MLMTKFVPYEKLSKKAKKEIDKKKRTLWQMNVTTKRIESKKHYNRKKSRNTDNFRNTDSFILQKKGTVLSVP